MNNNGTRGLASIVIPCWNQLQFTRQCVAALRQHTRPPWELIVIDNGSTDDTAAYLGGVQDAAAVPVTVISNTINREFPAAINQGLQVARGDYLVLLNNDLVVTDAWLEQMVALATGPPTIGLVGPMSNYASPPQGVDDVPYRDMREMHSFARRWRDEHRGQWFTVPKVSGFCLLMKRELYDKIGGLDERFGLGMFDDDDLAERAHRAGFEAAVAHDLFVHHFGSRTFVGNGIDAEALLDENARRFAAKWGLNRTNGRRAALRPWEGGFPSRRGAGEEEISRQAAKPANHSRSIVSGASNGVSASLRTGGPAAALAAAEPFPSSHLAPLRLGVSSPSDGSSSPVVLREKPSASLTIIVKNEENNLSKCLESVRGVFDEIVEAQPGSFGTDRFDRAQALCADRADLPDDGRNARGAADLCRRSQARPGGRRVVVPQGRDSSVSRRIG
jgi:GT2 family glycosyltransferase